jgi:hypothetical protein
LYVSVHFKGLQLLPHSKAKGRVCDSEHKSFCSHSNPEPTTVQDRTLKRRKKEGRRSGMMEDVRKK